MTDWPTFAGFAGVVTAAVLVLAALSRHAVASDGPDDADDGPGVNVDADDDAGDSTAGATLEASSPPIDPSPTAPPGARQLADADPDAASLLASVALTQGAFGVVLLAGVVVADVPATALGLSVPSTGAVLTGLGLGAVLAVANEVGARVGDRLGFANGEALRTALAPATAGGWVALLLVVLPTVAVFEELLFRGALVGALAVGFGVSPWLLAVLSSAAFAVGHGAQGPAGIVVTGVLGFALAAAFVLTGSLLVVVLAHYVVNAVEFLLHESDL